MTPLSKDDVLKLYEIAEINEQLINDLKSICGLDVEKELINILLAEIEIKLRDYHKNSPAPRSSSI